ncbi:hypothetical protein CFC21_089412, partial [Triticum aestivum]
NHPAGPKT